MLNYLWSFMILTGIVYAAFTGRMPDITNAALDSSKEMCIRDSHTDIFLYKIFQFDIHTERDRTFE